MTQSLEETAIIILNYNGRQHLAEFLPSVISHTQAYRIIVVDNGSTDDSVAFVQENFLAVELLLSNENRGFAGGYNWALKQIHAKYYILLNSDVEVTPNWVAPLVQLLESSPHIAACQPKILNYQNKRYFEYAGAAGGFLDKYGYPFCRGRIFDTIEQDTGQYDDTREIFWASGACLAIKAQDFHGVSGFDSDFFAHMEEIDLCWRLKQTGKQIFYTSNSTVFHLGGGTLPKSNPKKTFLNFRNSLLMLLKNLPKEKLFPVIFIRMVLDGIAAIRELTRGNVADFKAILNAHIAFYQMLSKTKEKRKNGASVTGLYQSLIIKAYFFSKISVFSKLKSTKFRI